MNSPQDLAGVKCLRAEGVGSGGGQCAWTWCCELIHAQGSFLRTKKMAEVCLFLFKFCKPVKNGPHLVKHPCSLKVDQKSARSGTLYQY